MLRTDELRNAIKTLYPIVPNKTTMPILQNIKFETRNGQLELTATDLEHSLTLYLHTDTEYNTCIPAQTLNELLTVVSAPEIDIVQKDNYVTVNRNPGKTRINTMQTDDFPVTDIAPHNIIDIDAQTFASAIKMCMVSVSDDKSHPVLSGILLESHNNELRIASADGFRMTQIKLMFGMPDFSLIIPSESAKAIISVLKDGKANLAINENRFAIFSNDFRLTSQLIAGNFPDVGRLVPLTWATGIEIDKTVLSKAVKSAMIFARDMANIIKLNITENNLVVIGESPEKGNDSTSVKCFTTGKQELEIAVNGYYLLEGLTLADDKVILKFNGAQQPIGMFIPNDDTFIHLMMPMHLGKK